MKVRILGLAMLFVILLYPFMDSMGSRPHLDLSDEEPGLSMIAMPPETVTGDIMTDGSVFISVIDAERTVHHFAFPVSDEILLTSRGEITHMEVYYGTPLVGMLDPGGKQLDGEPFVDHARAKRGLIQLLRRYRDPNDHGAANAYYRLLQRKPRFYDGILN